MAISDKTRKTLWGRAGNRCAMCRVELVADRNEHDRNLNIGDECHIVSEKENGPRYAANFGKDFDEYDNLILLCKNHHKTIDELYETYAVDLLKTVKKNHEVWVSQVLENARAGKKKDTVKILNRITTGKQLADIINDVAGYRFDHDELTTQEEVSFIGGFLQNLEDWGDVAGMGGMETSQLTQLGFDLTKEIIELEKQGFFVFGEKFSSKMTNSNKDDLGRWNIATILVIRKTNPAVIDSSKLATAHH